MQVRRFWAFVEVKAGPDAEYPARIWGGSDTSEEDARNRARQRADSIDWSSLARGDRPPRPGAGYQYTRGANPEPMIEEFLDENGKRVAAITINRYGVRVLNTARLVFVDIDLEGMTHEKLRVIETAPTNEARGIRRLFLRAFRSMRPSLDEIERAVCGRLEEWADAGNERGARLYRTAKGWRVLVSAPTMDPTLPEAASFMSMLGCDPAYMVLCRAQECFRARLTPKPWRLSAVASPERSDYATYHHPDGALLAWMIDYERASVSHAVCELVSTIGNNSIPKGIAGTLISLHDDSTGVGSGLPLA